MLRYDYMFIYIFNVFIIHYCFYFWGLVIAGSVYSAHCVLVSQHNIAYMLPAYLNILSGELQNLFWLLFGFTFQLGENVVFNFITVNFMYVIFAKSFNKEIAIPCVDRPLPSQNIINLHFISNACQYCGISLNTVFMAKYSGHFRFPLMPAIAKYYFGQHGAKIGPQNIVTITRLTFTARYFVECVKAFSR